MKNKKNLFLLMSGYFLCSHALSAPNNISSEFHNQFDDEIQVELYGSYGDAGVGDTELESEKGAGYNIDIDSEIFSVKVSQSEAARMSKFETQIAIIDYYGKWRVRGAVHFSSYIEDSRGWGRESNKHFDSGVGADIGYILGDQKNHIILGGGVQFADLENSYKYNSKSFKTRKGAPLFLTFELYNSLGEYLTTNVVGRATLTTDNTYKVQLDSTAYFKLTKNISLLAAQKYADYENLKEMSTHVGFKASVGK